MQFTSESITDDVIERTFNVSVKGESVPGVIWTPTDLSKGYPVVLMGHGGGHHKKIAYLVDLAHKYVRKLGFAVVAIDAPGHGERMPSEQGAQFAAELQKKLAEGQPVEELVAKEMARLGMQAVPEWQATLGAVQALDYIGTEEQVGYWGISMAGAIGVYLVATEPGISAAVLGLTGLPPNHKALADTAAQITIPIEFVLQWDDEFVPRDSGLALFDALGSRAKTLHVNPGDHAGIPVWEFESWDRFFYRHLETKTAG